MMKKKNVMCKILAVILVVLIVGASTDVKTIAKAINMDNSVEEKAEIENIINQYFKLKYDSYGKLEVQKEIVNLMVDNNYTREEMMIIDTMIKFRKMQLEDLSYDDYELNLDISIIYLDEYEAKANVIESSIINYNGFPGVESEMQGLYNTIELEKVNGEWLINNIYYDDVIREELKAYSEESANSVTYMEDLSDEMNVTSNESIYTLSAAQDMLLLDAAQEVAAYKAEIEEAMNKSDVIEDDGIATTNATLNSYNRTSAVNYARNNVLKETISGFNNYESMGGDCTNFVSACLYNGGIPMDYSGSSDTTKWYYVSSSNRVPSWTGAEYFHQYMINNNPSSATSNTGLFAMQSMLSSLREGDVVQNNKNTAGHSMIISQATLITGAAYKDHLICQRSTGSSGRLKDVPLSSKGYTSAGYYKIYGYY